MVPLSAAANEAELQAGFAQRAQSNLIRRYRTNLGKTLTDVAEGSPVRCDGGCEYGELPHYHVIATGLIEVPD